MLKGITIALISTIGFFSEDIGAVPYCRLKGNGNAPLKGRLLNQYIYQDIPLNTALKQPSGKFPMQFNYTDIECDYRDMKCARTPFCTILDSNCAEISDICNGNGECSGRNSKCNCYEGSWGPNCQYTISTVSQFNEQSDSICGCVTDECLCNKRLDSDPASDSTSGLNSNLANDIICPVENCYKTHIKLYDNGTVSGQFRDEIVFNNKTGIFELVKDITLCGGEVRIGSNVIFDGMNKMITNTNKRPLSLLFNGTVRYKPLTPLIRQIRTFNTTVKNLILYGAHYGILLESCAKFTIHNILMHHINTAIHLASRVINNKFGSIWNIFTSSSVYKQYGGWISRSNRIEDYKAPVYNIERDEFICINGNWNWTSTKSRAPNSGEKISNAVIWNCPDVNLELENSLLFNPPALMFRSRYIRAASQCSGPCKGNYVYNKNSGNFELLCKEKCDLCRDITLKRGKNDDSNLYPQFRRDEKYKNGTRFFLTDNITLCSGQNIKLESGVSLNGNGYFIIKGNSSIDPMRESEREREEVDIGDYGIYIRGKICTSIYNLSITGFYHNIVFEFSKYNLVRNVNFYNSKWSDIQVGNFDSSVNFFYRNRLNGDKYSISGTGKNNIYLDNYMKRVPRGRILESNQINNIDNTCSYNYGPEISLQKCSNIIIEPKYVDDYEINFEFISTEGNIPNSSTLIIPYRYSFIFFLIISIYIHYIH